jgi:hypothetical protein
MIETDPTERMDGVMCEVVKLVFCERGKMWKKGEGDDTREGENFVRGNPR